MQNEDKSAVPDAGAGHHGDEQRQPVQWGVRRSIRPGTPVPATLLVAEMSDGSLVLYGWGDGPSAYLMVEDAGPLRRELAAAFGCTDAPAPGVTGEPR